MGGGNLVSVVVVGGMLALLVGAIVGLYLYRGREHRKGMARFRQVCRAGGLTQGPEMWATVIDGVRVGARCVRYDYLRDDNVNRNYYRWDISYLAVIAPPLHVDLDAFARVQRNQAAPDGYAAYPSMWRRTDRPPPVPMTVDAIEGKLHVHATDPARVAAVLGEPDVAEALREAVALCNDVRVTDTTVELLDEPYEPDAETFDGRLRLAARIASGISAQSQHDS